MQSAWVRQSVLLNFAVLLSASCLLPGQSSPDSSVQQHMARAEQALRTGDMAVAEREYHEMLGARSPE